MARFNPRNTGVQPAEFYTYTDLNYKKNGHI